MEKNVSLFYIVLLFADPKEAQISHTLEPPTWCFVQVLCSSFAGIWCFLAGFCNNFTFLFSKTKFFYLECGRVPGETGGCLVLDVS